MRDFLGMKNDSAGGGETATKNVKGVPYDTQITMKNNIAASSELNHSHSLAAEKSAWRIPSISFIYIEKNALSARQTDVKQALVNLNVVGPEMWYGSFT